MWYLEKTSELYYDDFLFDVYYFSNSDFSIKWIINPFNDEITWIIQ